MNPSPGCLALHLGALICRCIATIATIAAIAAIAMSLCMQGCVFTRDVDAAIALSDALAVGSVQINAAPARGPDHFPFQVRG